MSSLNSPRMTLMIELPKDVRRQDLMLDQMQHVITLFGGRVAWRTEDDLLAMLQRLRERLATGNQQDPQQSITSPGS
ncbi:MULTISPECIES: hypothetical protein [Pseudomonas]|uniref:hypothetical protein n=1 Tax=Pseudomonas TaxID=286 RepID=UPI000AB4BA54|nr:MULTISPECIES: hypothetical protein [Pseudomonas]EEZ3328960.1 hypothetical protein [Escherichia coli]MDU4251239.1 hypothetical protein [Pseudomonas sp.]NMZ75063.1 hypothetical protein [Pseudomonas nitroreducens]